MTPMWFKLIKVLVLLFALFTTIVCINSEISKRREAEAAAASAAAELEAVRAATGNSGAGRADDMSGFTSENVLAILRGPNKTKELQAKEYNRNLLHEIFVVNDDKGLHLFNTTTADSAPSLMPIPTMLGDQPQNSNQNQSPIPASHYHQYHGLSQPDQYFKVQRSPDGKLNLVFNDTFVSLQGTNPQPQAQSQTMPVQAPSSKKPHDYRYRNSSECDEPNQESKSFCTQVDNYPDLSALKQKLAGKFAKFFSDDMAPTDITTRVGSAGHDDEVLLCKTNRRLLYPKKGQKADDTWQLIVNDEEFKQGIQIEECEEKEGTCEFSENFPQRYKPVCRQHYVMRNLASLPNSGQLDVVQDAFKIPSCCKCVLKKL